MNRFVDQSQVLGRVCEHDCWHVRHADSAVKRHGAESENRMNTSLPL
jgi:hypothetical protein